MKKKLQLLFLSISCISTVFCTSSFLELIINQPLTPFHLLKIPLIGVPEDVHFIKATTTITDNTQKLVHTSHYPILKTTTGETFVLVHFLWLVKSELYEIQKSPFSENPVKITCSYTYGPTLETHLALLQISKDPITNIRTLKKTIQLNNLKSKDILPFDKEHQKAIIFVHGILGGRYESILENHFKTSSDEWGNELIKHYWQKHYQYDNIDYFEYQYDSLFKPAKFYGEKLTEILEYSRILDSYKQIYLISYSMGTIVTRYAMNTKLNNSNGYMGEYITKAFMIGGVLEGTFLSNLTDSLITQIPLTGKFELINTYQNDEISEYLNKTLDIIFHLEQFVYDPNTLEDFFKNFLELYRANPIIANTIFISFEDIPFIGGQIIPYEGMSSMRYTSEQFLDELEKQLNIPEDTYLPNIELLELNQNEKFLNKLVFVTSYIEDAQETLKKIIHLTRLFDPKAVFENVTDKSTGVLSIPYVQFIGQRALSLIIEKIGESSDNPFHSMNDGFVTLWSEQLQDYKAGIKEENMFLIKNLDHAQIKDHPFVLKILKNSIQGD
ncbi:MAG: hypothetical protein ACLFQE_00955 [Thermotogota bacterium]